MINNMGCALVNHHHVKEITSKGTAQNNYTQAGSTFGVGGGFSKTPPIFEHYQQHFIGF